MINYIIDDAFYSREHDIIEIKINNIVKLKIDIKEKLIENLNRELDNLIIVDERNNKIQLGLLIVGILFLLLSRMFNSYYIWQEIFVIIGWFPIWKMTEIELFRDMKNRRKIKIIKKLLKSNFIIK